MKITIFVFWIQHRISMSAEQPPSIFGDSFLRNGKATNEQRWLIIGQGNNFEA
jgi:hypothetical protein